VRNIASGYGSATLREDNVGDPMISGRIDGVPYYVFFYGCDEGGESCRSIQFRAAWDMDDFTQSSIRSWNQNKRFGKAYLDQDDDPTIEWDVNLFGGVSVRNLDDSFDWWAIVLKDFEVYIK